MIGKLDTLELLRDIGVLTDVEFEEAYPRAAAEDKLKKLRTERPWTFDIIRVLWGTTAYKSMAELTKELWDIRRPSGLPMPKEFDRTVQSFLNTHTSQSSRWNGRPEDDLFYSPRGKGSGTWAVRRETAERWLKAKALPAV